MNNREYRRDVGPAKGDVTQAMDGLTGGENVAAKRTVDDIIGQAEEAAGRALRTPVTPSRRT